MLVYHFGFSCCNHCNKSLLKICSFLKEVRWSPTPVQTHTRFHTTFHISFLERSCLPTSTFKDSTALLALPICIVKTSRYCLHVLIHILANSKSWMEGGGNCIYLVEIISEWIHFIHLYALLSPFSQQRKSDKFSNTHLPVVPCAGLRNQISFLYKNLSTILYVVSCIYSLSEF